MSQPKKPIKGKPHKDDGNHTIDQCGHMVNGQYIHHHVVNATEGKELVKVYDTEGARMLIIPQRDPIDIPGIFGQTEFERLKKQATVLTMEDKLRILAENERKKNQLLEESEQRKANMLKAQKEHQQKIQTATGTENDMSNSGYLLKRSEELQMEQEDKVKTANGIILAAKCRAIRNAQVAEKKLIDKQMREEEMRLDRMMEQQRQKRIKEEEQKRENEEKKKQRYVTEVKEQIKQNDMARLLEAERIEEESRMLTKAFIEMQKQAEEEIKEKQLRQHLMREEFKKSNEETKYYKQLREEEQRIADLRVQDFMRKKQEREEQRERELGLIKAAKEKEIAMLRAQQQRSQDMQAAMDEINALRRQEEKEKEWREQEKQEALKRLRINKELKDGRQKQIEDIRKSQALALARDEEDFMRVVKVQRESFEKHQEEQKKKKDDIARHRKDLLKQIDEKEKERISWMSEKFEQGGAQRLEFQVKDRQVDDYLKQKIAKLKDYNIPEQYISDIERQIKQLK